MIDYGLRILCCRLVISMVTAGLLFSRCGASGQTDQTGGGHMQSYAAAPEDARRVIAPRLGIPNCARPKKPCNRCKPS